MAYLAGASADGDRLNGVGYTGLQQAPPGYKVIPPPVHSVPTSGIVFATGPTSSVHPQQPRGDVEKSTENFGASFADKNIRRLFVRKVYLLLFAQLLVTFAIVALFIFEPHVKYFVQHNRGVYFMAYGVFLFTYFTLICCPSVRRKYPGNLICLIIFTLAMSYLTGTVSSFYNTNLVFYAAGICAGVTLAISLLSMWSKFDFTGCGGMLWILCITLFFFGIVTIFTYNRLLHTIYAGLAALLLMMLLAYHTQLILGGRKYQLSPEEHIAATMMLYLDVVQLFLIILGLGGRK